MTVIVELKGKKLTVEAKNAEDYEIYDEAGKEVLDLTCEELSIVAAAIVEQTTSEAEAKYDDSLGR